MTRTRRTLVAGTALPAVLLAACGQAAPTGESSQPATGTGPQGTVQFWQWGVVYNDGFDALVKAFNGNASGVNVEMTPAANGVNYWDKLTAALAGAVGPDVYLMNSNARTWAAKGLMRPLDDLIKRDPEAAAANASIHPNFKEWYEVDGKQTGWGWDYSTIATVYNVAHLREAGLTPPADLGDAWDWNTFRDYGQKLTRAAGRWGAWANADYQTGWLNFVRANGGDYFTEDRKRCILGAPQAVEAIEFLTALVNRDRVSPTRADLAAVPGGAVRLFSEGRLSIGTVGDWSFVEIMKGADQSLEWDATVIPRKNGRTGSTANFRALVLNPETRAPDAAFAWLKFALSRPAQDRVPTLFNEVPARLDSAQEVYTDPAKAGPPAGRRLLRAAITATKAQPALDRVPPGDFHGIVGALVNDAWDAKLSAREAMTQAQERISALL